MPSRVVQPRHLSVPLSLFAGLGSPTSPIVGIIDAGHTVLRKVRVTFPTGCVGLVGFSLQLAGQRILPWTSGNVFIVGNGQTFEYDMDVEIDHGFAFACYNSDAYTHTLLVELTCDDLALVAQDQPTSPIVPIS